MRTLDRKLKKSRVAADPFITKKKHEELEAELLKLKKKRPRVAQEVSELAEMGDFSENVEYQLAKRRLRGINYGILKLEDQLRNAEIIEVKNSDVVQLGSVVTIKTDKGEWTYTILGASEADPSNGIISHVSPLGSELIGKKVGDVVEAKIGRCEIVEVK